MTELYAALQPILDAHQSSLTQGQEEAEEGRERAVQLAIMGLPNVVSQSKAPVRKQAVQESRMLRLATLSGVCARS